MHERQPAHDAVVGQIEVERRELLGAQHPFVDQRARRQAGDVAFSLLCLAQRTLDALPDDKQRPVQRRAVVCVKGQRHARDEELANDGLRSPRLLPGAQGIGGHVPPAEHAASGIGDRRGDALLTLYAAASIAREEYHADTVLACFRKADADGRAGAAQKGMGNLQKNSCTVSRFGVGAGGSAMREVAEEVQCVTHYLARPRAVQVRDEAHAAGVVLVGRIVQSLSHWRRHR